MKTIITTSPTPAIKIAVLVDGTAYDQMSSGQRIVTSIALKSILWTLAQITGAIKAVRS